MIIIEGTSSTLKHNGIGIVVLIRLYSYLLVIVIEDT